MKKYRVLTPLALAGAIAGTAALAADDEAGRTPPPTTGPTSTPLERSGEAMGPGSPAGDTAGPGAAQVNREELEKFAEVQEDLQDITMEYQQKMQEEGETPEARMNVQQEYQREITQAVNDAGLSAQQYNRIQSQVMTDPQLQERVQEMM